MKHMVMCVLWVACLGLMACSDVEKYSDGVSAGDCASLNCLEEERCGFVAGRRACLGGESLEGGSPCLADDDCPEGQGCLDLGNNVRACQLLCDVDAEDNPCSGGCQEVAGRGHCTCSLMGESACGDVFCVGELSATFCGPCRAMGQIIGSRFSDQCCNLDDQSVCQQLYRNEGLAEASALADCLVPEGGADEGVCGIAGQPGVDFQCVTARDCGVGETCRAAFGEECQAAGLDVEGRCLICVPL